MRRRVGPDIVKRAELVDTAMRHCHVDVDRLTGVALILLGVELLEDDGRSPDDLRNFFEKVLAAAPRDVRADTAGT